MSENTYLTAFHGMQAIFPDVGVYVKEFNRKSYAKAFRDYYEKNVPVYQAVESGYISAIDKEQYLLNMAGAVAEGGLSLKEAAPSRKKQDNLMLDMNLCLVVYVLPGILQFGGESAKPLTEEILKAWKRQFPKTNLSAASYEEIEAGFHRKWCYITTAVCETFGKPDDCYELTLLRNYRDSYLLKQPGGEEIVREYYDVAPTIVKHINRRPDHRKIYRKVWDTYLHPCIVMIENGERESCRELYIKMVRDLQEQYFM